MKRHIGPSPTRFRVLGLLSALALVGAAACSGETQFVDKSTARNVTTDDLTVAQHKPEGDGHSKGQHPNSSDPLDALLPNPEDPLGDRGSIEDEAEKDGMFNGTKPTHDDKDSPWKKDSSGLGDNSPARPLPGSGAVADNGPALPHPGSGSGGGQVADSPASGGNNAGSPPANSPPQTMPPGGDQQPPNTTPPAGDQAHAGETVIVDFQQKAGKVDILWLVDNSGSMEWAQSQLTKQFESFAKKLSDQKVLDFQVGVTTFDVCQINWTTGAAVADELCPDKSMITAGKKINGKMVGPLQGEFITDSTSGKKVLTPGSDFVSAFKRVASAGTSGSAMEHGLWAAKLAVEKSFSGVNPGFMRDDAFLSVIVLSDEEDDSVQMWCEDAYGRTSTNAAGNKDLNACKTGGKSPFLDAFGAPPYALTKNSSSQYMTQHKYTADDFVGYLNNKSVKGQGKFRVSAITGLRGSNGAINCNSPYVSSGEGPQESGTNYIKAAQLTGGVVENICSPDWNQILSNIGQNVSELANKIQLPDGKIPFAGTLVVKVDGKALDPASYTYEAQGNFVSFKSIPPAGSMVTITYKETVY